MIARPGPVVHSVAETMAHIAAAAAAAVWVVIAEEEALVEVEVVDFVVVVAVANGTVGRFRSGGDFPTRRPRDSIWGGVSAVDTDETAARALNGAEDLDHQRWGGHEGHPYKRATSISVLEAFVGMALRGHPTLSAKPRDTKT